jgi:hypothetical protein
MQNSASAYLRYPACSPEVEVVMSLQALWNLFQAIPAKRQLLAMFFALAGAWLLLPSPPPQPWRAWWPMARVRALPEVGHSTARVNRFFYQFGFFCLALALGMVSTAPIFECAPKRCEKGAHGRPPRSLHLPLQPAWRKRY